MSYTSHSLLEAARLFSSRLMLSVSLLGQRRPVFPYGDIPSLLDRQNDCRAGVAINLASCHRVSGAADTKDAIVWLANNDHCHPGGNHGERTKQICNNGDDRGRRERGGGGEGMG